RDSLLNNAFTAPATSYLYLIQGATGCDGGQSSDGTPGAAGNASSTLTLNHSAGVYASVGTAAGAGGARSGSGIGVIGGTATASVSVNSPSTVQLFASADGGKGG